MSEEEKKAIEWLKKADWFSARLYSGTILNLIENQQKEIEELKEEKAKRSWVHIKENGEVEPLFYISKDKIREKIKEIIEGDYTDLEIILVLQSLLKEE